ncbi:MAG: cache domain-containing protein [Thermoleophilia bacterium]
MKLRTKIVGLIVVVFVVVLVASYLMFGLLRGDITTGLGSVYAEKQVLYNRTRILLPLMRELALARKLADSSAIREWAHNEDDPELRSDALRELDDYRRFFSDGSYFFVINASGHYYFNDRGGRYTGSELRYTVDPVNPEDRWYFATVELGEPYKLNVDYDEQLEVTKLWMNVLVRDGERTLGVIGTGIDLSEFLDEVVLSDQPGVTTMFVDGGGAIQAHDKVELIDFRSISRDPAEQKTIQHLLDEERDRLEITAAMNRAKAGGDGHVETLFARLSGQEYLIGLTYVEEIGWFNVTLMDTGRMIGVDRFVPFALLLLAALVITSGALIVTLNGLVFRRVHRLDSWVRESAEGVVALPPSPGTRDELGTLEQGFQQLAQSVRKNTEQLEASVAARTRELAEKNENLEKALAEISTLSGLLPTCMYCKKIRDEATGEWSSMETYISQRSEAEFSHGICPDCEDKVFNSPTDEP